MVPSRSCAVGKDGFRLRGLTGQLSALGRQRRWEEALSLLLLEREASIRADVVAFTALVRACARAPAKAWPAAIATLYNMEDTIDAQPGLSSISCIQSMSSLWQSQIVCYSRRTGLWHRT